MKVRSLSRRVLTIVLSAQLFCAVLLSLFALLHEQHSRLRAFDESLKGRTDSVLGAIQDAEDAENNVTVDPRELKLPRGDAYRVYTADGTLLGGTPEAPADLAWGGPDGYRDARIGHATYRIYQRSGMRIIDRAETDGRGRERAVVILYAASKHHLEHEIVEAAGVYSSIIVLVVLGTGVLVVLLVRQALRPLQDFAAAAGLVALPALSFHPPASVVQVQELRPLAKVLDDLIGRLREAFAKERRFLGDAAHELKTAVAIVRSTVQVLMLKPRTTTEYSAGLDRVLEDVSRMETLIAQMLSSSGADDRNPSATGPLPLTETVEGVLTSLASFAEARHVGLRLECNDDVVVRLREDKATALISNLVLNAIQHSEPGMQVVARVCRDQSGSGVFEVIDSGSGIGTHALPHVFERFYREDRSRSRDTGGAGLGLAICKSIVEAAGGTIGIESQPGLGTTVQVIFSQS